MTLLRNLVLVLVFTIVYGDEHNHIVSIEMMHTMAFFFPKRYHILVSTELSSVAYASHIAVGINC